MHPKASLAVLAVVLLCGPPGPAGAFHLPDSGQRKCYQAVPPYAEVPCAGTGQDGAYSINPPSYVGNGDGTVTDNNTGLVWQGRDDGNAYNWYQASGTTDATFNPAAVDVCGALELGGASDWRLPTKKELVSLLDYAIPYPGPLVDAALFPDTRGGSDDFYWVSDPDLGNATFARAVSFGCGGTASHYRTDGMYVRCVRGVPAPAVPLQDNGDGTVTDSRTTLVWQQVYEGPLTWAEALASCEELSLGGATDWRLPNIRELESLSDDTRISPAIDTALFPGRWWDAVFFWTSTSYAYYPQWAWLVYFGDGDIIIGPQNDKYDAQHVRCVRGGAPPEPQPVRARFLSVGAQDGWVLESREDGSRGGALSTQGATVLVGDDAQDRQYRAFLSFGTGALPDDAEILSAKLSVKLRGRAGTNPFTTHGNIVVDAMRGAFSGIAALQTCDFQAPATRAAAAAIRNATTAGWYSAAIPATWINRGGPSQFRLRFARDDNEDRGADYLSFHSGNAAAYRPVLEVEYLPR